MFRTAVLRAARLSRVATVSKAGVIGLRPVIRASGASRTSLMGTASPVLSQLTAQDRFYSSYASGATQTEESAETAQESEPEKASGLITRFADLESLGVHTNLVRSLTETLGYETMTPVQSATITPALSGKDIVAQAKTGTGKTLAFLVPVIQKMITENPNLAYPRRIRAKANDILAIILSPTRELAEQIGEEARKLCHGTGVIVQTAVGGTRKREMLMRTRQQGCHLMIATPGRLNDILSDEMSGIDAPRLAALVLDEADRMLDVGFDQELREIVRHLPNRSEQPRQTLLFSATLPKNVISLARTYVDPTNFQFVQTIDANDSPTHEKVPQHIVEVKGYENIYPTVLELFKREIREAKEAGDEGKPFKAIVFLPTTNFVQLTAVAFRMLARSNPELPYLYHIHSKLTQSARTNAADMFRRANTGILFSSDVTARGMDFPNVTHVIQIGVPPDREQYIHRLGRTGRADKGGEGWIIVPRDEMRSARNVLVDLPIKRADGLESATHDLSTAEADVPPPELFTHVSSAMQRVPAGLLEDTYMSFFGGQSIGRNVQTTLDNLNEWVRLGWGWEQPPAIDQNLARKRGLLKLRGLRLADGSEPRRSDRDGRDGRDVSF
ncbi:dead box RNA helicase [Grosmannia clavigera kw1407]|uniref:ATP-dependent RNA helicase n=1 Tax=Grosmannia clavigera (strain kw1407 / UAMH 11150) TaxID=655863 RepID=F0XUS3_GROCL|nr:dead box RNA helicase [Grosmannia clavigera kw1407]EFW99056.1 dead box RNA helicase [Grosmannia clavigera kw1407]